VNRLEDISKITSKNDNIYKYSILTPKADDGKTLFTIEEYVAPSPEIRLIHGLTSR